MLDESTDLITIPTKAEVPALFAKKNGITDLAETIKKSALSEVFDYTTDKGRKHAKFVAGKASKAKTLVVDAGKSLNAERRAAIKAITEQSSLFSAEMDALRDKIKQPALDAEKAEADRVAAHLNALDQFAEITLTAQNTSGELQAQIDMTETVEVGKEWEEYEAEARAAKALALEKLRADQNIAVGREQQAAELEALRAKDAARDEADRVAKVEADAKEREVQRKADEERIATEAAEHAKANADREHKEAEERHERELEASKAREAEALQDKFDRDAAAELAEYQRQRHVEERHQKEILDAKAREDAATQAERDRLAQERADVKAAEDRRKADAEHRRRFISESVKSLAAKKPANWEEVIHMIINGEVPHAGYNF